MTREEFSRLLDAALVDGNRGRTSDKRADNSSRDLGALVTKSDEYLRFVSGKGERREDFEISFARTTGNPATTTGLTSIDKRPSVITLGVQPPRVADLMINTPTNATDVRYIQENSFANAAAPVVENGSLPEATWDLVEIDANVKRISCLARATEEMFRDFQQCSDFINSRLTYMNAIKEDNALLNADGTSGTIKGILQFAGIQNQVQGTDTALDAIYKAKSKVRKIGFFEPDAIVMHPNDLESIALMKDRNGQYYFGGPLTGSYGQPGQPGFMLMIWGLPVVWTTSIAQGTCLVGAFRMGAQIFRRPAVGIEFTNSDGSDFANDRVAIRASTRLTLACYRPLAFCTVTNLN